MFEKILLLGPMSSECELVKGKLSDSYFVICCQDVHSALQFIKKNNDIRLILIDIDTPKLVVEQFLEILRVHASYRNIKTIVVAEVGDQLRVARCLDKGASDFINKPIDPDALKLLIDLHINIDGDPGDSVSNDTNIIFETLFKDAPVGVAITRVTKINEKENLTTVVMNPAYERIIGRTKKELQNFDWKMVTHPDDIDMSRELFQKLERHEINSYSRQKRYVRPDGSTVWVNIIVSAFDVKNEDVFSYISLVQDITEQKQTSDALSESERSKSVLLSHLPGLAYRCRYDRDWTMEFVSKGCQKLTGYDPEDLLYNRKISYNDLIADEYQHLLWNEWKRTTQSHIPFTYEYEIVTKEGERKWVLELGEGIYDEQGQVIALEGIVIDINHLKVMEATLQHNHDFDPRTDLHNRAYFERLLNSDIRTGKVGSKALVALNLSSIQSLVLTNGYHFGMELITRIAQILKTFDTPNTQLFITHETRFCFYLDQYLGKDQLLEFYQRLKLALEPILLLERITCGVGILEVRNTRYPNADRMLKDALVATEKALNIEDQNVINFVFFDKEMQLQIEREKIISDELAVLAESFGSEGLIVHFQPVIDLKTDRVVSFEALTRFRSGRLGLISPLEFIPILEKSKLIVPVGEKILSLSLKFLKVLNEQGFDISISVNVSAIQLLSENFALRTVQKIRDIGVNPSRIWLEITESIFATNYQRINQILGEIMNTGVRVTIDDFGTGYSSLHRVLELNTNGIKIDRAFINGLEKITEDIAITKDIVSLGQKLNYIVVAEGIENETQMRYLKSYQCDRAQGYYFSRPLDEEKALDFIRKTNV